MELSGEQPYMGSWSELEHHIFLKIINSLVTQDIHTLEIPSIEKKVFTLYNDVMEYVANSKKLLLPLAHKKIKQIQAKIRQWKKSSVTHDIYGSISYPPS